MEVKPTIWIFSIEPIETRYTGQWQDHVPAMLREQCGHKFNIVQVEGVQKNTQVTPGAFLNFSDTNYWKSSQLCVWLDHYNDGNVTPNDQFLFTDAWNPTVIQLRYMNDLLGYNWKLHGLWHAGSYDPQDFLGRLVGDDLWVRTAESSFFHAFDHNYFATDFHIDLFANTFGFERAQAAWRDLNLIESKIIRTGWPMEYMPGLFKDYDTSEKEDIIIFPHRLAPEKQVEIFRDLAESLPQYKFVVCQDNKLTKHEYHKLLAKSKIMWSANLQETLGISPFEGALLGVIPMLPDRLSYTEMYDDEYLYPSKWTESYDSYLKYKSWIIGNITGAMKNYDTIVANVKNKLAPHLLTEYFTSTELTKQLLKE
jgi:hypothetical protein